MAEITQADRDCLFSAGENAALRTIATLRESLSEAEEQTAKYARQRDDVMANYATLRAENEKLRAALVEVDMSWTEWHPAGPDDPVRPIGKISDHTIEIWRKIRAALQGQSS